MHVELQKGKADDICNSFWNASYLNKLIGEGVEDELASNKSNTEKMQWK